MASDTDSNSSFEQVDDKSRHKKLKKKLEKKSRKHKKEKKSHKKKKRSRKEYSEEGEEREDNRETQNHLITQTKPEEILNINLENYSFGPVLPPHLLNKNKDVGNKQSLVIGPIIPKEFLGNKGKFGSKNSPEQLKSNELDSVVKSETEDDDLPGCYGPLPVNNELEMTQAQIELEQRALELKMAAIDGINAPTTQQNVREEWMLELPKIGLKSGLAALNNIKRGFHQGKEKPDFSDRSSWTKTPNSGMENPKPCSSKEQLELEAQALYEKQRDAEQEAIAKKHKHKHKRDKSLVEIHQKKLRKEEKKKAKELKDSGAKPERRAFTRDVDLKLNKIDRNQTKQIVDKAKILNTKFSSGHSKYL